VALDESAVSMRAAQEAVRLFSGRDVQFLVVSVAREPVPWVPVGGFGLVSVPPPGWEDAGPSLDETEIAERATEAGASPSRVITEVGDALPNDQRSLGLHPFGYVTASGSFRSELMAYPIAVNLVCSDHSPSVDH
jgi:hypothetical protein